MALYHFTLKSDRKPNKKKVKASEHTDYINREGKYANTDELAKKNLGNFITSAEVSDVFHGTPALLYHSPYGDISNTKNGVAVYRHPSLDTIAIALMVVQDKMQAPLVIEGSDKFKADCVVAALACDLPIRFADDTLQGIFTQKKEQDEHERRKYREAGGKIRRAGKNLSEPDTDGSRSILTESVTTRTLPAVHDLPQLSLVRSGQHPAEVLVRGDEVHRVGHAEPGADATLRRLVQDGRQRGIWADYRDGRRTRARRTADGILNVLEENADRVQAASHVEYINRENAFAKKGGCVYQQHRLPEWAHGSAKEFFSAADAYSPKNGTRYKEFEFSLQNELTLEQNLEIVNRFIERVLPHQYYALAVHDKIGALSGETHNLHCHLMFSPRIIDETEGKKPRKKSHFFKYPLRENVKNPTEKMLREHGAPNDRRFSDRQHVGEFRAIFAEITNEVLQKYGHRARVDHRSLKEQEREARMNGDTLLAEILHRIPEKHISKMSTMEERNPEVAQLMKYRDQKKEYRDLLIQADILERKLKENTAAEADNTREKKIHALVESNEFLESDNDASSYIGELRTNFLQAIEECEHLQAGIIPSKQAYNDARLEYMSDAEQELYEGWLHLQEEQEHWKTFRDNLKIPQEGAVSEEELAAYHELEWALEEKFATMDKLTETMQPQVDAILKRQENQDVKKQIFFIAHQALEANKHQQMLLDKAKQNLEVSIKALEQALFSVEQQEGRQESYTTRELYRIIRRRFFGYKKEVERLKKQIATVEKKVLTPQRIQQIAEDRFTGGAFKDLREQKRKFAKAKEKLDKSIDRYLACDKALQALPASHPSYAETRKMAEELHRDMSTEQEKFKNWEAQITSKEQALSARVSTPEAKDKIHNIALGVARGNAKYVERLQSLKQRLTVAEEKLERVRPQFEALSKKYARDKKNTRHYRVEKDRVPKDTDYPDAIAQALSGQDKGMPNNVSCRDDEDDMGMKNWKLMSVLEREEEYNKRFSAQI